MKQEKEKIEFRYYELPKDLPILALLGEEWELPYGTDLVHFHNHLEIGYCYYGEGVMCYGEMRTAYDKGTLTVIPKNYPHRTDGGQKDIQKWEYLFIDAEELTLQVRLILEQMREKKEFYRERVRLSVLSLLLDIAQLHAQDEVIQDTSVAGESLSLLTATVDYISEHYMEDIAMRTGFQTTGAFTRNFKKLVGELPKDWRKKVRESETNMGNYNVSLLKGW